ncbi:MAG: DNA gyrase subunit A, partial [Synergistaceae bacterium]|nr:DNA gyrase subunit A [Synergistaceae bacterium]
TGIAVGMATNMPPHNLREVVKVLCWLIENNIEPEDAELRDILELLPGPDFPTGGEILGRSGIIDAYTTGRGKIIVRGKMHVEENKRGRKSIVVTEIPYYVNKTILLESMVKEVQDKEIEGVTEIRDESDRDGLRIVIEITKDSEPEFIMRQLYKRTQLQTTFGVINLALVNKHPEILPMKKLLSIYLNYRREIVTRRTEYRLRQAQAREHLIEGLKKALENIETVIKIIRAANKADEAKENLQKELEFSSAQAQAILDMRLQRLTGLERSRLDEEQNRLLAEISELKNILADKKVLDGVIASELKEIASKFGDDRRTTITEEVEELTREDFIQEEDIVVTLSKDGLIKRQPLEYYKLQARGGKGRKGTSVQEDDSVEMLCVTHTHREIFFFTNFGRIMALKGYEIPETKTGKGKPTAKLLPLAENEKIVNIAGSDSSGWKFAFFITRKGIAKRLSYESLRYSNRAKRVMSLDEGDEIARVALTTGRNELLIITKGGQGLRVSEKEFRPMGCAARGVKGINLKKEDDEVLSCDVVNDKKKM